jgi:hypothetical protein
MFSCGNLGGHGAAIPTGIRGERTTIRDFSPTGHRRFCRPLLRTARSNVSIYSPSGHSRKFPPAIGRGSAPSSNWDGTDTPSLPCLLSSSQFLLLVTRDEYPRRWEWPASPVQFASISVSLSTSPGEGSGPAATVAGNQFAVVD